MFSDHKLKAVIVEDEHASREYLINLLAVHFPRISIAAVEDTVQPAVASITKHQPDMVFMDIEIKMGTGFDVLEQTIGQAFDVLFTTAFDQFAIDAFQYNAIDYLLKPLENDKVIRSVQRSIHKITSQRSNEEVIRLLQYLKRPPARQRIPVNTMYGFEFIEMDDILFAEAEGNYSRLRLKTGKSITITKKLKELEEQLPEPLFIRVHHSYLVNTGCIKKYYKGRGGHVVLDDESSIPVSPSRKDELLKLFDQKL